LSKFLLSLSGERGFALAQETAVTVLIERLRDKAYWTTILVGFFILQIIAGFVVVNIAADRLVAVEARRAGAEWADFLLRNIADFNRILEGEIPSLESIVFLEQAKQSDTILQFRVYDRSGRLRLISTDIGNAFTYDSTIARDRPELTSLLTAGQSFSLTTKTDMHGKNRHMSQTFVPVRPTGPILGWIEILADQEVSRGLIIGAATQIAIVMGVLLALGPAFGFWYRSREKTKVEKTLSFITNHDQLTKLPTRAIFSRQLDEMLKQAERRNEHTAILDIEIDRLRELYEHYDRQTIDSLLLEFSARLQAMTGPLGISARLSDGEFAVLKSSVHDAMEAAQLARTALQSLTQPIGVKGQNISLNINIGLALAPTDGRTAVDLLKSADIALVSSKAAGRNSYRFFDSDTENGLRKRRAIESAVKEACEQKLFELHYQPVFELRSNRLTGFEALIRLNHPHHGSIPPSEFIPVAESIGLIGDIGAWTLETACLMAAQWPDPLKIAVNLSPLQFRSGSMISSVRRSLEHAKFPAYRLELEVTEGLLLDDTEYVREQLRALQETGVGIVLDDFGAGYSSLGYLWQFPFNKLKIDQSFVRAMDTKSNVRNILRAIIGLGRSLSLPITAEGVETAEQADYLRSLDCTEAQGYHFGRPVPSTDVAAVILRNFTETSPVPAPVTSGVERLMKLVK
jgi:diguanylate cyclase (GGDEF)-like protein